MTKGPISAGRQWEELSGSDSGPAGKRRRKSRSSSSATRFPDRLLRIGSVSKAGRKSGRPKKGRGTSDGFRREVGFRIEFKGRPDRAKDQRTFGPRSLVDRSGSSQEGAVR